MTELTFLVDLLLNHKLPKATRDAVASRIREFETFVTSRPPVADRGPSRLATGGDCGVRVDIPAHLVGQSPSTIAAMMRHEQAGAPPVVPIVQPEPPIVPPAAPPPVAIVAQTPAAQAAMNARADTIGKAISGKPGPGQTSPRKW